MNNLFHQLAKIYFIAIALLLGSANATAALLPGESITFDPVSGNYTLKYTDEYGEISDATFEPATKIDPAVSSSIKLGEGGQIAYRYKLVNGVKSKQTLVRFHLDFIGSIVADRPLIKSWNDAATDPQGFATNLMADMAAGEKALTTPAGWEGAANPAGMRVGWFFSRNDFDVTKGLKPGASQNGFGFSSRDLPGIVLAQLQGNAYYHLSFSGDGPAYGTDIGQQAKQLKQNNFVPRPVAVPTIPVPTPFSAAVVLDGIRANFGTWLGMQLLDATYSSQLDRYLVAAADAYRHAQPKAGKEHIETLRKMLKKEHEDLGRDEEHESENSRENDEEHKSKMISRLAARVLDFDLKYVLKRMDDDGAHERERKK